MLLGVRSILSLLVAAGLLFPGIARADCEDGIDLLTPRLAAVKDDHLRALLLIDLRQAQRDLWEFDEVECAVALEHATRLLRTAP